MPTTRRLLAVGAHSAQLAARFTALFAALLAAACTPEGIVASPSDDPADWNVDTSLEYQPVLSEPRFVVPSDALPVLTNAANNNVAIELYDGRLFLAWRTAPSHFASADAEMHVVSSTDNGESWTHEHTIALGSDVREPNLLVLADTLWLTFFQAGTDPYAFEPQAMWRTRRAVDGSWDELEPWGGPTEVPWDQKRRGGRALMTLYSGEHYGSGVPDVRVHLRGSADGTAWTDVDRDRPDVYRGGASEAGFEIDEDGGLWAVLRNEDGDASGFGSLVCHAPADSLSAWECPSVSDPERYDSPKMLRHGDDVYLLARRDVGGPFDQGNDALPLEDQRTQYAAAYWNRPKRTALYRIDKATRSVEHLLDLPSAGDTAFPSVRRTGADTFLVANYTSPLDDPDRTWLEGQGALDGTSIYLITLSFRPR